jgi:hypothetical protein
LYQEVLLSCGQPFLFAFLFLAMLTRTQLPVVYLGRAGIKTLAAIIGVPDVDPFILWMTQFPGYHCFSEGRGGRGLEGRTEQQLW